MVCIFTNNEVLVIVGKHLIVQSVSLDPPLIDFPIDHDFGKFPTHLSFSREEMYDTGGR